MACILPLWLAIGFQLYYSYNSKKAQVIHSTFDTSQALALAVDRELASIEAALGALATSPAFQIGDWATIHGQATTLLASYPGCDIIVADGDRQQLVNSFRPFGTPLPKRNNAGAVQRVFENGKPSVTDLFFGAVTRRPLIGVDLPVWVGGRVQYDLALTIPADRLARILAEQNLPPGWIAAILDRKGIILARNQKPELFVGSLASQGLRKATASAPGGTFKDVTLDGTPVFSAFNRSELSGWSVGVGVPAASLFADIRQWLWWALGGAGLSSAAGIAVATLIGRRIARASQDLQRFGEIVDTTGDMLAFIDRQQRHRFANSAYAKLLGTTERNIWGRHLNEVMDESLYEKAKSSVEKALAGEKQEWVITHEFEREKPQTFEVEYRPFRADGVVLGVVVRLQDITGRKAAEEEIKTLAFFDTLTGLPNRRLLQDRLRQAVAACERSSHLGALLFIDLDNFKTLNDTRGHAVGDKLLVEVAQRLQACVRQVDIVARLGGDEFVILLENLGKSPVEAKKQAERIANTVIVVLNEPYHLADHYHHTSPSIGAALFGGRESEDEVLTRADLAMYQAKSGGRNTLRFFDPAMQASVVARSTLEAELRRAVVQREMVLHYQPQIDQRGRVIGAEALLRWQHPRDGLVSPATFIPLAEETGIIVELGAQVLETACRQLVLWQNDAATHDLSLAVNVSARQFRQPTFVEDIQAVLQTTGADPRRLKLEMTESVLLHDLDDVSAKMMALREIGVSFSLDDFGTGYSSLTYLKLLPFQQVKIDRSFVRDVTMDPDDAAIARSIIILGKSLGLKVIAEGVETQAQWDFLRGEDCDEAQGFLFAPPVPADALQKTIEALGKANMYSAACAVSDGPQAAIR